MSVKEVFKFTEQGASENILIKFNREYIQYMYFLFFLVWKLYFDKKKCTYSELVIIYILLFIIHS